MIICKVFIVKYALTVSKYTLYAYNMKLYPRFVISRLQYPYVSHRLARLYGYCSLDITKHG